MKVYQIGDQSGLQALTLSERPDPVASPGQVVVKVHALGLNHRDLKIVSGAYGPKKPPERVPTSEGVGEVIALGDGVTGLALGDRVVCAHFVTWLTGPFTPSAFAVDLGVTVDGWLAEQVVIPAAALIKVPAELSDEQAAPLAAAGLTAWNALVDVGKIKSGDLVLTLGTGGVSIFALQIAKMHGARVAITSSSDEKLEAARKLGADILVNYKTHPDWAAEVVRQSGQGGADIIVETGGAATLTHSITAAAPNGRIVLIGALGGATVPELSNLSSMIGKGLTLRGIAEGSRAMLSDFVKAAAANNLKPVINRTFSFAEAPAAYAYLAAADHMGKIMIKVAG